MRRAVFLFSCVFVYLQTFAQPYVEGGNTRHRFAQLNFGIDQQFISGINTEHFVFENGQLVPSEIANQSETRLQIGGTHFWGHADFYVAFKIVSYTKSGYSTGVETGGKYYPWRIENHKLRPFVGAAFISQNYVQGDGVILTNIRYPLLLGLSYLHKQHLFELRFAFTNQPKQRYFVDKSIFANLNLPQFSLGIGYKFMLETTLSAEKDWQSGRTAKVTEALAAKGKLSGITVGIGASSAFFTQESSFNEGEFAYLGQHKIANIFPEFAVGYYFFKPDLQLNFAFRNIKSTLKAYGHKQVAKRTSYTLEAYKFLFDYHGFVPFVGPSVNYEVLQLSNTIDGATTFDNWEGVKPGITFGWDIRPNRLQYFYLRTNLRFTPNLNLSTQSGQRFSFNQLEFNFIELVVFPELFFKH